MIEETPDFARDEWNNDEGQDNYRLTNFGRVMASYALAAETCYYLRRDFLETGTAPIGGLPRDYRRSDLEDGKYLLDIFCLICKEAKEVERINYPKLQDSANQNQQETFQKVKIAILKYIEKYKNTHEGEKTFWTNSYISDLIKDEAKINAKDLTPVLRAILLYHWTKGELLNEIREHTGLNNIGLIFNAGDMERLAEGTSYILEAISKCMATSSIPERSDAELRPAFYRLSSQVKYGTKDPNLIQVANRNVPGVNRKTVIELGKAAKKRGFENVKLYIFSDDRSLSRYLTSTQLRELRIQLNDRYNNPSGDLKDLAEKVNTDFLGGLVGNELTMLLEIREPSEWMSNLEKLLGRLKGIRVLPLRELKNGRLILNDSDERLAVYMSNSDNDESDEGVYSDGMSNLSDKWIFLGTPPVSNRDIEAHMVEMTRHVFCTILLQSIAISGESTGKWLWLYLSELEGHASDRIVANLKDLIHGKRKSVHKYGSEELALEPTDTSQSPFERYCEKYSYQSHGKMNEQRGNAHLYKAYQDNVSAPFAIKEITFPSNQEELDYISSKAKFWRDKIESLEDVSPEGIKVLLYEKNETECRLSQELLNEASDKVIECWEQLPKKISSEDRIDSIAASMASVVEAYQRLNEIKLASDIGKNNEESHIVPVFNPFISFNDSKSSNTQKNSLGAYIYFAMPLYDGDVGELRNVDINGIADICRHVCVALQLCHKNNVVHRDIKPMNILYRKGDDESGNTYYLCDFGSANKMGDNRTIKAGTIGYMPPEAGKGIYMPYSDIYSLGKTLQKIKELNKIDTNEKQSNVISKMCEEDMMKRYQTIDELLKDFDKVFS